MITRENLADFLRADGFEPHDGVWRRVFPLTGCFIDVDTDNETIIYPEAAGFKVNERETCNFSQNENFVVLECVCRLLEKGYRPESIELERRWPLGHGSSGGRGDICVNGRDGETLAIIECKTSGGEYRHELRNMEADGGQLFTYWAVESACQWLVLYASDLTDGSIVASQTTVRCGDDPNVAALARKDETIKLYADVAHKPGNLYAVWDETYGKQTFGNILFNESARAYEPLLSPLRKRDLRDFRAEDRIVNRFEEILRHNNVSDRENAFNRLTALFIAKLQDELGKDDDDEVDFQYRPGTDDYESLQDRLQHLHHDGMLNLMKEDVLYVPADYAEKVIRQYTGQNRRNLIDELQKKFRMLKFYTNNDFAFKDVHNEELFLQNGRILVEMVQLLQPYRIVDSGDIQFLGDLFEQLLNQGFKQNEGQFFTPEPITRFIWKALPVDGLMNGENGAVSYPRTIDYACGAGHFLNTGVEEINKAAGTDDSSWVEKHIFGIEKDYRLSRVSRIALFMHGAGDGQIIFGDGLENYPDKGVTPGSFDILVANPPYSVSSFKPYLKLRNNSLSVLDGISDSGSEIETLFVERAAQLVRPGGVAAIILPPSVLTTKTGGYPLAREVLLKSFAIRSIVNLGAGTFGATTTSTIVLFLQRFPEPPRRMRLVQDSVDAIFESRDLKDWEDSVILASYLRDRGSSMESMKAFADRTRHWEEWKDDPQFGCYARAFGNAGEFKNLRKKTIYKRSSPEARRNMEDDEFYRTYTPVEKDKLYYYSLTYDSRTLIVNSPEGRNDLKEFLGYEWSNGRGREGIQVNARGGLLFPTADNGGRATVSEMVRDSFDGTCDDTGLGGLAGTYRTSELLDLNGPSFPKTMTAPRRIFHQAPYPDGVPSGPLSAVARLVEERADHIDPANYVNTDRMLPEREGIKPYQGGAVPASANSFRKGDVLVSNIRPYLKKAWLADHDGTCSPDVLVLRPETGMMSSEFLYTIIWQDEFFDYLMSTARGLKMPRGDKSRLLEYVVPIPDRRRQERASHAFIGMLGRLSDLKARLDGIERDRDSAFRSIFGNPTDPDPQWKVTTLDRLGTFRNGINYGANERGERIHCVTVKDFGDRRTLDDYADVDEIELSKRPSREQMLETGDILFVRSNGNKRLVGRCMEVRVGEGTPLTYSGFCIRYRPNGSIDGGYLLTFLKTKEIRERLTGQGGNIQNISQDKLKTIPVPLPPGDLIDRYRRIESQLSDEEDGLIDDRNHLLRDIAGFMDAEFRP